MLAQHFLYSVQQPVFTSKDQLVLALLITDTNVSILDWKTHVGEYYQCSKYKEDASGADKGDRTEAREALHKYLHYFTRVLTFIQYLRTRVLTFIQYLRLLTYVNNFLKYLQGGVCYEDTYIYMLELGHFHFLQLVYYSSSGITVVDVVLQLGYYSSQGITVVGILQQSWYYSSHGIAIVEVLQQSVYYNSRSITVVRVLQ